MKIKHKLLKEIFSIYGTRTYEENDCGLFYEITEFLVWWYGSWSWQNAKDFEPYKNVTE